MVGVEELKDFEDNSVDLVVSSACMIKGHFTNNCFDTFVKVLKQGCNMVFTIRDKYLNSDTDSGMNFHGALN